MSKILDITIIVLAVIEVVWVSYLIIKDAIRKIRKIN